MDTKWIRALISAVGVSVAVAHVLRPDLAIDDVTLLALVVTVLPWLRPLFRSVELPGGLKIEFQEVKEISEKAQEAGLIAAGAKSEKKFTLQGVAEVEPNLALAGLRIELEKALFALAVANGFQGRARGIGSLLRFLEAQELLSPRETAVIRDIVAMLNEAVHGATMTKRSTALALDFGTEILVTLNLRLSHS